MLGVYTLFLRFGFLNGLWSFDASLNYVNDVGVHREHIEEMDE